MKAKMNADVWIDCSDFVNVKQPNIQYVVLSDKLFTTIYEIL